MARLNRWLGIGLAGLAAGISMPLAAQSLWLPASDPVGIARGGAGIAFGQSLEGASLNPALLVTLRDRSSAYLGLGMEMASSQITLPSNQRSLFSEDRNRVLPSFGAAWRFRDQFSFGVKLDEPFLRHAEMPTESAIRFLGKSLDLKTQRLEFQGAWALRSDFSIGAGIGFARLNYASSVCYRVQFPIDPTQPVGALDPLVEIDVRQKGSATVPTWSLGFRWAINPRWTFSGAHQSSLRGNVKLSAERGDAAPSYYDYTGLASAPTGDVTAAGAAAFLAQAHYQPGSRRIVLPAKTSFGVRHRLNQSMTWEFDLRYVAGSSLELPSSPTMTTPNGVVGTRLEGGYRSGFGGSLMGELNLAKNWTVRLGVSLDPALQDDAAVNPIISGARSAAFSGGVGYRRWGGELNFGYQFRQNLDQDGVGLDGTWRGTGYQRTGTATRVEGMGHLWSFGFKRSF